MLQTMLTISMPRRFPRQVSIPPGLRLHMTANTQTVGQRMSTGVTQQCQDTPVNQQEMTKKNHAQILSLIPPKEQMQHPQSKAIYAETSAAAGEIR
jgi:hypothetical protein